MLAKKLCISTAGAVGLLTTAVAALQPADPPALTMPLQGMRGEMACDQMMGGTISPGAMQAAMTFGWVIGVLTRLSAIFALVSRDVFLLRRSRSTVMTAGRPNTPLRGAHAT